MHEKIHGCLVLMRPANLVTSCADILAGFGIAGVPFILSHPDQLTTMLVLLLLLLISTIGLYGGGVVMNDVYDASLDTVERPERPIPKGIISKNQAVALLVILLIIGIAAAFLVSFTSGLIAILIAIFSLVYNAYTKPALILGPINIGLCRALNLLLGISVVSVTLPSLWMLMFIPLIYISGVSLISKQEVTVTNKNMLIIALVLYTLAVAGVLSLYYLPDFNLLFALPYLFLFVIAAFSSLLNAYFKPQPQQIRKAVTLGIVSLIVLDAAIASGYAGWWYGLILLVLIPLTIFMAKKFAVT